MATTIKKVSFKDLTIIFDSMCSKIDALFEKVKTEKKGKKAYDGFDNFKEFLRHIETTAIDETAKEFNVKEGAVRDQWKVITLPLPVYLALENDQISFSKAKLLTALVFDSENPKDIELSQKLVDEMKRDITVDEIKALVKKESVNIWNSHTVVMEMMARQNGIIYSTVC